MPLLTRNSAAAIAALPAVLVPVIEIPLVLWARAAFLERNPDYLEEPPTISRAINDPLIGAPFADLILVIAALIAMATPIIAWSYALAIARLELSRGRRKALQALLALFVLLQVTASSGMVLTTQYSFDSNHDLHMLGSYLFFFFQALAILAAAVLCRMLHHRQKAQGIADPDWQFRPALHRFRFRFALVIAGLAALFGVLFAIKDHVPDAHAYAVQVLYTQCEVVVIAFYVLFMGTYGLDIFEMVRRGKLRAPFLSLATSDGSPAATAEQPAPASERR